jgi:hypothetical protein
MVRSEVLSVPAARAETAAGPSAVGTFGDRGPSESRARRRADVLASRTRLARRRARRRAVLGAA